ncbi:MAG TPA: hypothetical protein VLK36_11840 [Gaiellaceae bacterium]|nr:hypothetical protein [Gaiellaceae bacterium]
MGRRVLPALLAAAAWWADGRGSPGLALDALLVAIPFAAAAGLTAFGDAVEGRRELARLQAALWALCAGLLVLSCAARSAHDATGSLPPLGTSALAACFGVFALKLVLGAAVFVRGAAPRAAKP